MLTVVVWFIAIVVMGVNCFFIIDSLVRERLIDIVSLYVLALLLLLPQDITGPWYQHLLVSLGLLAYIIIVAFFVSSKACSN